MLGLDVVGRPYVYLRDDKYVRGRLGGNVPESWRQKEKVQRIAARNQRTTSGTASGEDMYPWINWFSLGIWVFFVVKRSIVQLLRASCILKSPIVRKVQQYSGK